MSRVCVHAFVGAIAEEDPERPSSVTRSVSGQLGTELLMRAYSSTSDAFRLEDLEEKLEDVSRVYMAVFKLFVTHAVPNYQQPWAKQQVRPCHPLIPTYDYILRSSQLQLCIYICIVYICILSDHSHSYTSQVMSCLWLDDAVDCETIHS